MKNLYIFNYLKVFIVLFIISLNFNLIYSQSFSISGPINVNKGDTKTYNTSSSTTGSWYNWDVTGGATIVSHTRNNVTVRWNGYSSGIQHLLYDANINGSNVHAELQVNVTVIRPNAPGNPTITNSVCNQSTLKRTGSPSGGDVWYWQGKSASGTSTTKGSGSTFIANEGTGTYYIRARNSSGEWSAASGYVYVSIAHETTWYADSDGDGFGNPNVSQIACLKPSGYVNNSSDINDTTQNITNITPRYFYRDIDGDGFGDPNNSVFYSVQPSGYVTNNTDDCPSLNGPYNGCLNNPSLPLTITGPINVNKGETKSYSISSPTTGSWYNWDSSSGVTIISQTRNNVTVRWDGSGTKFLIYDSDLNEGNVHIELQVNVNVIRPNAPGNPTITNSVCNQSTLNRTGSPSGGDVWYWQGKSASGTSTTKGSGSTFIANEGTGTYYIRARNSSGEWSSASGSVYVSIAHETIWYADSDGDGFGNPNVSKIACSKPSGYVNNSSDINDTTQNITNIPPRYFYRDAEGDTFGDPNDSVFYSIQPSGYVTNNTDDCPTVNGPNNGCSSNPTLPLIIIGPTSVYKGETKSYSISSPTTGSWYNWDVSGGATIVSHTRNNVTVRWDGYDSGMQHLLYDTDVNNTNVHVDFLVNVTVIRPDEPEDPAVINSSCGESTLQRTGLPSNGDTWYWQGKSANGTNTTKGSGTTFIANQGSGTYYIRARNSSGEWSAASGSVFVTITEPLTWYVDTDGDTFGDSSTTKIQCTKPSGFVNNNSDYDDTTDLITNIAPQYYYRDADGDTFGDPNDSIFQSIQPSGFVTNNTDECPEVYGANKGCIGIPYQAISFPNENYILSRAYQAPMTNSIEVAFNSDVIEQITYVDGLGRPKQSVGIRAGGNSEDIITPIDYDDYGRQDLEYLPYASSSAIGSFRNNAITNTSGNYIGSTHYNFYKNSSKYENTSNPYSEKEFEPSPLNRVLKQAAPGEDWKLGSGHEIGFEYNFNKENEVRLFTVTFSGGNSEAPNLYQNNGFYVANELYKTVTKDENWTLIDGKNHTTEEFKDKQGRVVLKRTYADSDLNNNGLIESGETEINHDTYYVYDKFGNLTYVIPPKVTTEVVSNIEMDQLCYQYKYDDRNRLIEKKIPGKDWEYIVYNTLDQPVLTQDSNLRENDQWLFTKYDAFGRVACTGLIDNTHSRTSLQTAAYDTIRYKQFVQRTASPSTYGGTPVYYNNEAIPQVMAEIHTINYSDDYNFDLAGLTIPTGSIFNQTIATNVTGLPTGSKVRVLGTNQWITTLMVYDAKGRAIYVAAKNEYLGTTDIVETSYDFTGKVLESKTTHTKGSNTPIVTIDAFTYDHAGRLLKQTQTINEGSPELIAENHYDELGQLDQKKVGNNATTPLQAVDYTYNIRGWLKQINNPPTLGTDLFAFKIGYNEGSTPLYNGNISLTQWKTKNTDQSLKTYNYLYDPLNRITAATGGANTNYDVSNISYDKMGNIQSLTRNGWQDSATYTNMDVLDYDYDSGNKLLKVADTGNDAHGFKDGTNTNNDFEYDVNGNLKIDRNKGITNIAYNHLNLPTQVTFASGNIQYFYSADGTKQKKVVSTGTETLYAGNYIYEGTTGNAQLQFFNHPEGYVTPDGNGGYDYVYNYKDHLGNIRISYTDANGDGSVGTSEIVKESNYYPYGMTHRGYNDNVSSLGNAVAKKYMFGGKEYQDDNVGGTQLNWYDVTARNYDPALGRWMNLDPLAEDMTRHSPYNYAFDNPIYYIDPDGMSPFDNYKIYSDGSILRQITDDATDSFTYVDEGGASHDIGTYDKNENGLIQTPTVNYENEGTSVNITTKAENADRQFISGKGLASLIGASADSGEEISVVSVSNSDGTSPSPSTSHKNGVNLDIRYAGQNGSRESINYEGSKTEFDKIDQTASGTMNASLQKFGYKNIKSSTLTISSTTTGNDGQPVTTTDSYSVSGTSHLDDHYDHEHLQGYNPNITTRTFQTATPIRTNPAIQPKINF